MDKLFIKCLESYKRLDRWLAYGLAECKMKNAHFELNTNELFEYLYWDYILQEHVMNNCYIQMLLIKYGDRLIDLVKMYLVTNKNDYDMKNEQKEIYRQTLKELTFDYGDYKMPKEFIQLYGDEMIKGYLLENN